MKEIEDNKAAWASLSKEHYTKFLHEYKEQTFRFSQKIAAELGDIRGKRLIHLQCNTGADSIWLAKMGAIVTGVDLVPENVRFAKMMAHELGVANIRFFDCDLMTLSAKHHEKYDVVFTSEGAVIWLPDLGQWARTIRALLDEHGFFYVSDAHPFYLMLDEDQYLHGKLHVKYPYFHRTADESDTIGGYAAPPRKARNYSWMYSVSTIINSLIQAGLNIEFFHEEPGYMCDLGAMEQKADGMYYSRHFQDQIPMMFSLRASIQK
jgi:2-polyprenyl-3-methyl-5-hydroxy-6-metoxy-1,4-benzoquinol methylase